MTFSSCSLKVVRNCVPSLFNCQLTNKIHKSNVIFDKCDENVDCFMFDKNDLKVADLFELIIGAHLDLLFQTNVCLMNMMYRYRNMYKVERYLDLKLEKYRILTGTTENDNISDS
ncbi:unnamed protein product [Didymodactylos carnosus]|uniref:Uncharacterized protein n=1 Tax=Didymodactylos carnosus TaxID=1234261 RepID=A0A813P4M1_9BILA|nr:unnamed protein product [Didymodactylos carnosus]CAF0749097.1 unnamed protein product [Didymodactylos carnosus]CAF3502673.1 unnamed protein product [Didymodactylos carnosus]CAF3528349.1 unnamed protein product [Didymodactylos carnosus]